MAQKLSAGFMAELFKLVYMDLNITRMVVNNLTYQLIPKEWPGFKFLLKEATEVLKEKDSGYHNTHDYENNGFLCKW